jgi:hypothetical protein
MAPLDCYWDSFVATWGKDNPGHHLAGGILGGDF